MVRYILSGLFVWIVSGFIAFIVVALAFVTLGKSREWSRKSLIAPMARFFLRQAKINLEVSSRISIPESPCIYISNHTSAIDIFAVGALSLSRCRYFLSKSTLVHLPLTLLALSLGVHYLPDQSKQAARKEIFQKAASYLKKSGESIFLTPEGQRVTSGSIGHFNKGAFHLALELKLPIVCLYIECRDPLNNRHYGLLGPATCDVTFFDLIPPSFVAVGEESINDLRELVFNKYLGFHNDRANQY